MGTLITHSVGAEPTSLFLSRDENPFFHHFFRFPDLVYLLLALFVLCWLFDGPNRKSLCSRADICAKVFLAGILHDSRKRDQLHQVIALLGDLGNIAHPIENIFQ